jgi:hypothetical protein
LEAESQVTEYKKVQKFTESLLNNKKG